jgi:putative phosphoribosyl transferase
MQEVASEQEEVQVAREGGNLGASLFIPSAARGLVLFAHGSGSSRFSPRNRAVAAALQQAGLATFLMDLLTPDEEREEVQSRHHRFNIGMLADRLLLALDWLQTRDDTRSLAVGIFGASTGAGAALIAAARRPKQVLAIVSRGGRPDLAGDFLRQVQTPTLLIVGGHDQPVITVNEAAAARLMCVKELVIIPRAAHLFEEPGALEEVARLAGAWFSHHLASRYATREPGQPN